MHRNCEIIGVASGWGSQLRGCEDAPEVLYKKVALKSCRVTQKYLWEILYPLFQAKHHPVDLQDVLPLITELNGHLSHSVIAALQQGYFPVVIGGDHSIALGTWSGVKQSLGKGKQLGLIWIDAHMDCQIPGIGSPFWNGMSLAALLGCGDPAFIPAEQAHPILQPENVCLIGVRSTDQNEIELLQRMKVQVYTMDEVKKQGFVEVMQDAIKIVTKNTAGFGVSLDLAAIDPKEAPGVSSPLGGGIVSSDLLKMLAAVTDHSALKAFEIVEYNPHKDRDERTACLCLEILGRIMGHGKPKKT
ncbi:MAG: arginase [Chlamydiae bacterium]|nr:arginase [Chlamydiota bacterium]